MFITWPLFLKTFLYRSTFLFYLKKCFEGEILEDADGVCWVLLLQPTDTVRNNKHNNVRDRRDIQISLNSLSRRT